MTDKYSPQEINADTKSKKVTGKKTAEGHLGFIVAGKNHTRRDCDQRQCGQA